MAKYKYQTKEDFLKWHPKLRKQNYDKQELEKYHTVADTQIEIIEQEQNSVELATEVESIQEKPEETAVEEFTSEKETTTEEVPSQNETKEETTTVENEKKSRRRKRKKSS